MNTLSSSLPLRSNRALLCMTAVYGAFWGWMAVSPSSRYDWFLENLLIFATLIALAATYRRFAFSNRSYAMTALFLALHTWGAHYSYGSMPIEAWLQSITGSTRDNYDRIVHFCYGLLLAHPIFEFLLRYAKLGRGTAYIFSATVILASGAFYELIEMWVAHLVAPEIGTLFIGTQGDEWDTQHDMELALYGAIIALSVTAGMRRMIARKLV
ncbi:DUF2238 domain-containing protein [Paenibacillus hamazuiensis]|uniref:DUF2238 domain-containing protein n=1 Tax=Paenibacillus hamazuiensis TaxID=2936508 RepID=UPI00200E5758|nr:DUF2238 domain-containing protein [Paenibacillus hamazuiensis]